MPARSGGAGRRGKHDSALRVDVVFFVQGRNLTPRKLYDAAANVDFCAVGQANILGERRELLAHALQHLTFAEYKLRGAAGVHGQAARLGRARVRSQPEAGP